MAGQIYINDDLLWQDQSLVEPLSRSWNMPRYWNIPASALQQGENIIWIRVVAVTTQSSGIGHVLLGDSSQIMPKYQKFWHEQRVLLFFNLIASLVLTIVALLVWLFRRKEHMFGWFTLTSLFWVLFITTVVTTEPLFGFSTLQIARINIILFLYFCLCFCLYAWRIAHRTFPRIEKSLLILAITNTIIAIFVPDSSLQWFLPLCFFIATFILFANFLTFPFIAIKVKQTESTLLAIIFIFYLVITIHDLNVLLTSPAQGQMLFYYTSPLTTLLIAIILAIRLTKNVKHIEKFNKILNDTVIKAQNDLTTSLNQQHQLELENTKLQERMSLAHDLHDSLGSSLVRSIAMIDQSRDNLTNPQFLSMLKLLRNDLRQIIDSGSSSGTKTPETPKIWGAEIRYRFEQIFDELEIESIWLFPDQWQNQPLTLECLTYLRVIEETLTNILKHSQAKNVRVELFYPDCQSLVIEIEDDGIGFDVAAAIQSGISVGLRSMQVRLEKIQANLDIQSQRGKTLIRVVKRQTTL